MNASGGGSSRKPVRSLRVGPAIERATSRHVNFTGRMEQICERYLKLRQLLLPELSRAEWICVLAALTGGVGVVDDAERGWEHVQSYVHAYGEALAQRAGVDGVALVEKLRALPPGSMTAVVDVAEEFWALPRDGSMEEKLAALGVRV